MTTRERFMTKLRKEPNGCWIWTAARTDGYGSFWLSGRQHQAHRVAYELLVGPIPNGKVIDHLCQVRACVNPAHMEVVTLQENLQRRVLPRGAATVNGSKTHCPHGHPYDEANTIVGKGSRTCRTCRRAYQRDLRARRRAKERAAA